MGLDVKTITSHLGFSRNYWSAVENHRTMLSRSKLEALLELFELEEPETEEVLALREAGRRRGWWAQHSALLQDELIEFYGLEAGAESIRTYESLLVTGLLQTEDYARAIINSDPAVSPAFAEKRVRIRMQRQQRLQGTDPLHLTAIMSQAVLLQHTGGTDVLRAQLHHLADLSERHSESIDIRIIPFSAGPTGMIGSGTLFLLDFESPRLPTIAWQEAVIPLGIIEESDHLNTLSLAYRQALNVCLSREESSALIRNSAEQIC